MDTSIADGLNTATNFLNRISTDVANVSVIAGQASGVIGNLKGLEIRPIINQPTIKVPITDTIKQIAPFVLVAVAVIGLILVYTVQK